jgi:hypothetical protein
MPVPFITVKNIEDATFQANPEYELVPFDRLAREQQEILADYPNRGLRTWGR